MKNSPSVPLRPVGAAAAALLTLAGCSVMRGGLDMPEGPFLTPGSLVAAGEYPGGRGAAPRRAAPVAQAASAPSLLPAGLVNDGGLRPLHGARYPGVGPLGALVIPISLGNMLPTHDDAGIATELFGEGGEEGQGVRGLVHTESAGALRFTTRTLPLLIDPRRHSRDGVLDAGVLGRIAESALHSWARQIDLSIYDNEGPDGIPFSRDDDGRIDMVILPVESERPFPSQILHQEFELRSGGKRLRSGHVLAVHVPRGGPADPADAARLVLHTMGLEAECFFPDGFGRKISSLARVRLGWLPASPVTVGGLYPVPAETGIIVPLTDMPKGMGFWLVEREGERVYTTRVIKHVDGRFVPTRVEQTEIREGEKMLTLTRQLGARGPRARVFWDAPAGEPRMEVVLTAPEAEAQRAAPVRPLQPIQPHAAVPAAGRREVPASAVGNGIENAARRVSQAPLEP